jgi:hypothetical protein
VEEVVDAELDGEVLVPVGRGDFDHFSLGVEGRGEQGKSQGYSTD